jgi:cell volume regulation protein A
MPPPLAPDPRLLGDFFVAGHVTLGALAEIYGLSIPPEETGLPITAYIEQSLIHPPKQGDIVPLGSIALVVHRMKDDRISSVGLRLPVEDDATLLARIKRAARRLWA